MSAAATRPEDDIGLAGKVAIIAGGGAAGDGIGNGRAAAMLLARAGRACWWSTVTRAGRAHRGHDRRGRRHGCRASGRPHRQCPGPRDGRCRARPLRPPRFPRQQRRHRQPRLGGGGEPGDLAPRHAGQRRADVPRRQARHPRHDQDGGPRRHRQHLLDLGAAPARAHRLHRLQRRRDRAHPRHGRRPRQGRHSRQLRGAGPRLHADGLCARHEPSRARYAPQGLRARHRGHRLGHRPGRALSPVRPCALHHGTDPGRGRRRDAAVAGTATTNRTEPKETRPMAHPPTSKANPE